MKFLSLLALCLYLAACGSDAGAPDVSEESTAPAPRRPYENLSPEEFAAKMDDGEVILLDVRTPREIAAGKIDGAVELDFNAPDFADRIADLDRAPTYLVYCAAGGRSNKACQLMADEGFERVYNLDGGFTAWQHR